MEARALLEHALQQVVLALGDPAPRVHERLLQRHPHLRELWVNDARGAVHGEMFLRALDAVLDHCAGAAYPRNWLDTERINHAQLGVPADAFDSYYEVMAEVFAQSLGAQWTTAVQATWEQAVASLKEPV